MEDYNYKEKIIKTLGQAGPLDVEKIKELAGIGNWNTCLKHCLELLIVGKIQGMKSSKSWIFWLDNASVSDQRKAQSIPMKVHSHAKEIKSI